MNKPTSKKNKLRNKGSCKSLFAMSLLTLSSLCQEVKAGQTWTGGSLTNNNWSDTGNWGGAGPSYPAGINFGGGLRLIPFNDNAAAVGGTGITFNVGAGAFNLTGGAITLTGGITNNSANVQTVSFGTTGITLGGNQTWNSGTLLGGGLTVGSAVNLAGQPLTVDGTNNTTISGAVTDSGPGTGSINKINTGTLLLSGTNTFTGTTTVSNGLLQLQNGAAIANSAAVIVTAPGALALLNSETIGSLSGTGNTNLNANTLTVGNDGVVPFAGNSTYAGNLTGVGGSLVKNGTGIFTTSGTNTYTGTTTVNTGTLNVTGTHTGGGNYTIAPGATLAGTGVITEALGASITENGAIVVGDATLLVPVASTLSISTSGLGAIVMGAGSTLAVDLFTGAGLGNNNVVPGSSDKFNLGGNLNSVAGGTLVIGNPNAMKSFTGGDSWQVVNLAPGATITGNLGLTGNLNTSALNLTATQVGNFNQTSGVFTIIDTLTGLQMANAMGQAVLAGAQSVLTDVNGRLFFLRAGQGDLSDDSEYDQGVLNGQGDGPGKNPAPSPMVQRRPQTGQWQVFATANYNNARLGGFGQQAGIQSDSWTQGIGAEVHVTPNVALGFALNWLESRQTFANNVGAMDMNGYALSAYTSYVKKAFWADLLYNFGSYDIDTNRNPIGFAMARGDTNAYTNSIQFNSGWNFRFQNNSLVTGPFIGLDYTHVSIDAYGESGGGLAALAYNKRTAESLISRIGWSVSKYVKTDFAVITAQARLSYERQNLGNNGTTVGLINQPFTVGGGAQHYGQDYMVAGAGLNFQFTPSLGLLLNYQGQYFRQSVQAHYVGLRLSYKF